MNLVKRIILDLEHAGYLFRQRLKDIGIEDALKYYESGARSDLEYVYHESSVQILMIHEPTIQNFLSKLQRGPEFKFFTHLQVFADPQARTTYAQAYIEFGLSVAFQINRHLGANQEVEYLLDASAPGYLVISQVKREIDFQPMMDQMNQHKL